MAGEPQFTIGARASCTDGHCGVVRRLIIDPATETVTHLVIQPGHRQEAGRLVPMHLVETTDGKSGCAARARSSTSSTTPRNATWSRAQNPPR